MRTEPGPGLGTSTGSPCLVLKGITKRFGGVTAANAVDLRVAPGERRIIIGPNGAGKTTLFNLVSGAFPPTSGAIFLFGEDITALPPHRRVARGLGRTFQIIHLFANLSVQENVVLALLGRHRARFVALRPLGAYRELHEEAAERLRSVDLLARRADPARLLSNGEQRRLEILLALAQRPRLLLLDEPMAGLSPGERQAVLALLGRIGRDIPLVMIEHDMDLALDLADRVTVLHYGEVIAEGTPAEIRANPTVQEIYLGED
ncbi:MAG TPA: ABC transporter ATP-binding protein [Candidatus Sulfotelmatobacter sp.]|nr:ABC transporter ATP-binding protein [Candidatus Sulfotelmatobacter sp.]